jgi:hypothetical protein
LSTRILPQINLSAPHECPKALSQSALSTKDNYWVKQYFVEHLEDIFNSNKEWEEYTLRCLTA